MRIKADPIKAKRVDYEVIYTGENCVSFDHGKKYKCIGEITDDFQKGFLIIIDETGEDYIFSPKNFKKVTD